MSDERRDFGSAVGQKAPDVRADAGAILAALNYVGPSGAHRSEVWTEARNALQRLTARLDRREGALPDPETEALRAELGRVTAERDRYSDRCGEVNVERQRQEVRAELAEDARAAAEAEVVRLTRELEFARSLTERATRALTQVRKRAEGAELAVARGRGNPLAAAREALADLANLGRSLAESATKDESGGGVSAGEQT